MACVDGSLISLLESTLNWFEAVNEDNTLLDSSYFKMNHEAMLRACHKEDFQTVSRARIQDLQRSGQAFGRD